MNRAEYLNKLESLRDSHTGAELVLAHEWLLCEYVQSLEKQIERSSPTPATLTNTHVGDLVLLQDHDRTSLHYITFYGKDERLSHAWGYYGNIIKLDGTYCFLREDGRAIASGETKYFAIQVFHKYDLRFNCTSDR